MNIANGLEGFATSRPDAAALIFEGRTVSYGELNSWASRIAVRLEELGVAVGERVALVLPNIPEFVAAYVAVQKLGGIAVSLNPTFTTRELNYLLEDSAPRVVVCLKDCAERLPTDAPYQKVVVGSRTQDHSDWTAWSSLDEGTCDRPARELSENTPAAIIYSSGTTGYQKGVTLSHHNVISNARAKGHYCGITPADRLLLFMPLFHCFGQNAIMNAAFQVGAAVVLQQGFTLSNVAATLERGEATMFFAVPTVYNLLLREDVDFGGIRYCLSAAAPMPTEVAKRFQEKYDLVIYEGYGLTESSPFASYNHQRSYRPGSIGTAIEGVEMRIGNPDTGAPMPNGELGEILIRGENVMLGYWNRPQETAEVMREGWLRSGDLGRQDADGYFFIVDRIKDMIDVGGMKVYPAEVEHVLYAHPLVQEVAVYGVPDDLTGEGVVCAIVSDQGDAAARDELLRYCRKELAPYKFPREMHFVDELPKNRVGKILKRVLRDQYARSC